MNGVLIHVDHQTTVAVVDCAACEAATWIHPDLCPSIRVDGVRRAICRSCFDAWEHLHPGKFKLDPRAYPDPVDLGFGDFALEG